MILKKIKVAHVLDSVGGVEIYLRLVSENINPECIENIIVHKSNPNKKQYLDKHGNSIKEFNIDIQREINLIKDIKAVYQTVKILKKEKPDIIHAHSAKGGIIARVASLFYKVNVLHTPHAYSYLSTNSKIKRKLFLLLESLFSRVNSYLLATSNSEIERGINEVGYHPDKTILFNNSILPMNSNDGEFNDFKLPDEFICSVGRPSFQKNIEMMIEVIKRMKLKKPNIHLVLMGVGEYSPNKNAVNQLIEEYELQSNVTLVDWIEREKILQIIKQAKLYISTSRYEGLPYSIIESLSLSKACVVTQCDGNKDLVKEGHNGFLIKDFDEMEMSDRICQLLDDDVLRQKFEQNSFNLFNKEFNLENNIKDLENIYDMLKSN
ncbi:glycosyltransferase [Tamlana fucoidanivorans]|uniref:Glycosyltransferase family 4 protein n=1 Tax=Allotamlana fucoidanivorans TaxID=2583814 RepID=A0A5C4SRJ4_9FLAO|nr:glycosyltransferase family 4 protein [Tamlana fucoidanivorans]